MTGNGSSGFFGDVLHIVRVTLETASPLAIGDADNAAETDTAVVRDANGLPTIPGPSMAGVLRHLHWTSHADEEVAEKETNALFGFIAEGKNEGKAARLTFGWGCVHDSKGKAIQGLLFAPLHDPLLAALSDDEPIAREHVALNERGVVAGAGKFDRAAVPRGTRFSFEISMWGGGAAANLKSDKTRLAELVGLIEHPAFRLGGAARRGYGACRIVCDAGGPLVFHRAFNIGAGRVNSVAAELRTCRSAPPSDRQDFDRLNPISPKSDALTVKLKLTPRGLWRIGDGDTPFVEPPARSNAQDEELGPADMLVLSEPWIDWSNGTGDIRRPGGKDAHLLIPGSSIKGALAHRIVFHLNRIEGRFIDAGHSKKEDVVALSDRAKDANVDLADLLGLAKSKGKDSGCAARLIVDDCIVSLPGDSIGRINHNRIDRFTQGVMTGGLYSEEAAFKGDWLIKLTVLRGPLGADKENHGYAPNVWKALEAAIADLCEGRLALGAKSMGFATGSAAWAQAAEQAA
jgi:CRISPR/Cas system CMR subunit Cmr4 (Cas7 group RAMP superfamily)